MKYDILIFVQAAADLRYALDIIDKNRNKKIQLYVIHVKAIYDFVSSLNLQNVKIDFQDYFSFKVKDVRTYLKVKKKLSVFWKKEFSGNSYEAIYFFSRFYDFHTASIIVKLGNKNVIYYDHYDTASIINDQKVDKFSLLYFKNKYIAQVVSLISGADFISVHRKRYLEFNYKKYGIERRLITKLVKVNTEFKYSTTRSEQSNNVIFLLSPDELDMITKDAHLKLKEIIFFLKNQGYKLYLKGHPRLGTPEFYLDFFHEEIPNYVPTEFLSYEEFSFTIGVISSGLVYPSLLNEHKVYSVVNLLEFNINKDKRFFSDFLKEHSKNNVIFVKKPSDLV
jgi:hypothetical protein